MQPWIIDANNMDAEDIDRFESNLLHPIPSIERFLDVTNKSVTIVVAPKGFGKTLLLKAKRLSIKDNITHLIPSGRLVEKAAGAPSISPYKGYDNLREQPHYWKSLWLISFTITIARSTNNVPTKLSSSLKAIFEDENLSAVTDIFDHVHSQSLPTYYALRNDYNDYLNPSFKQLRESCAIFLDNIDEYFEDTLRMAMDSSSEGGPSNRRDHWYLVQQGVAEAARELSSINNHVKFYVSIRKEAIRRMTRHGPIALQLTDMLLDIRYSTGDLIEIINKNILASTKSALCLPNARDPIVAFFGDLTHITHPITGDEETVVDYWLRHTLGRPRDVVAIGRALSELRPKERTERQVAEAIRSCAKFIVDAYITEMLPHLEGFEPHRLLGHIGKNVFSKKELAAIAEAYTAGCAASGVGYETHREHPFCALFKIGLLGYVERDTGTNEDVQVFKLPGEDSLDRVGILPDATIYLIHPALVDLIAESKPKILEHMDDRNIVGRGRPWRRHRDTQFLIKGDIVKYSQIMRDPLRQKRFISYLDELILNFKDELDLAERSEGDSLLLIDTNATKVIKAAQSIIADIKQSEYEAAVRFAGEAGFLEIDSSGGKATIFGMAIQHASRLEPHVEPGSIYVSGEFKTRVEADHRAPQFIFTELKERDAPELPFRDGSFNIGKPGGDETIWIKIYRLGSRPIRQ